MNQVTGMSNTNDIAFSDQPAVILSEEEVIQEAQQNPKAFKRLYERNYRAIFGFVYKRINDKQTTADITQQVFLKALSSIKKYKYKGLPYSAFLYRIAVNECNAFFRSNNKTRFVVIEEGVSENLIDELGDDDDDDIKAQSLKDTFQQLKEDEMHLIELRFFEMRSFKEVAYILDISENLAKVRTYRLLSKMKKIMER